MPLLRARHRAAAVLFAALAAWPFAAAPATFPDSLGAWIPTGDGSHFDHTSRGDYLRVHAFSLDNYLEFVPGGVLVRTGPVGYVSAYSRWGIGHGRAALSINGIPFNDPENGRAPWSDIATSELGRLDAEATSRAPYWIEGSMVLNTSPPVLSRPSTYIELSKGTNALRQRRVKFGSEEGRVGLDLTYDELLNDGYNFDATGGIGYAPDFGRARSRNTAMVLRGSPDDRAAFTFGFRQFESITTGDLTDTAVEGTRNGHLAWLDAAAGPARVTVYGRGFTSARADSETVNETTAIAFEMGSDGEERGVVARITAGHTAFSQDVRGHWYTDRLLGGSGVVSARSRLGGDMEVFGGGSAEGDEKSDVVWGAFGGLRRVSPRQIVAVQAGRSSRLPTLAERFLPAHTTGGVTLVGDKGVKPEHAFEVRGDWEQRRGALVNRLRASWIRAEQHVAFRPRDVAGLTWRVASNGDGRESMFFLEERLLGEFAPGPFRARAEASVLASSGDRVETFRSVPELQGNASLLVGGEMFQATSALYVGAEYTHMGARSDYDGRALPAFNVLNVSLHARLIDVHMYLRYMNVLDERYATFGDCLMTPRTFVYGIEWTLYD